MQGTVKCGVTVAASELPEVIPVDDGTAWVHVAEFGPTAAASMDTSIVKVTAFGAPVPSEVIVQVTTPVPFEPPEVSVGVHAPVPEADEDT